MKKVLGIDEAGRGPVIGPMVITGVMVKEGNEKILGEVKDSKFVYQNKRVKLAKQIIENKDIWHKTLIIEPEVIDAAIFSGELNLNWLEAYKQAEIINELNPDIAIIDCPSINCNAYKNFLEKLLKNKKINLIVEHKADVNYKVVSAASILAKVEREAQMKNIREKYGDCGPGYPSNKTTIEFVKNNWDKYPKIFRKSWSTYRRYARPEGQKSVMDY